MTTTRVKVKPTQKQLRVLVAIGQGSTIREISAEWDIPYYTLIDRVQVLKRMSRKPTIASVVYWALSRGDIHFTPGMGIQKPKALHLEIVARIATGFTEAQICEQLHISKNSYERQVRDARRYAGATTQAHLVAICWAEDWIA